MKEELYNSVMEYAREKFPGEIDAAYDYFWEEEDPSEFLMGLALDIAFVNFEDWLVCDYKPREGKGFIDRYIDDKNPASEPRAVLEAMRNSFISLYEVVSGNEGLILNDLALGRQLTVSDVRLNGLGPGEVFAARVFKSGGILVLGRCVYPFGSRKDQALSFLEKQFNRYIKNKNPGGDTETFLREESYVFNTLWVSCLATR